MTRLSKLVAALAVLPVLAISGSALADSPGQLTGGSDVVAVRNATKATSYSSSASVACNEEVEYSIRLHNAANGGLTNVQVSANISNGTVKAVPAEGASAGTTGSVSVSVSGGTLTYENGSAKLFNSAGTVIKTLADTVTTSGVNVGNISGSTTEFVNFNAKVSCPVTPTPVVAFACTDLGVKQIDRTHYDFTATATAKNATVQSYTFTAVDSNNKTVNTAVVNTSALSAVYHFNQEAGKYTVSAVVKTDQGSTKAFDCSKQITVAAVPTTPTPPATPVTPTTPALPDTGAGDVVGIFAGASAAGTAAHAVVSRRRRN